MSTVLVTSSKAQFQIKQTSVVSIPVDSQFQIGIPPESATVVLATFPIAPGPQATVLPSWAPASADYTAFLAAGLLTQLTQASTTTLLGTAASQNTLLSVTGSPTTIVLTNPGNQPAYVALGASSVSVAVGVGTLVAPGASVSLAIGSNTYLAYIGWGSVLQVVLGS
jgi:hypothetical protein